MYKHYFLFGLLLILSGCTISAPASSSSGQQMTATGNNGVITGILLDQQGAPISDLGVFVATLTDGPNNQGKIISFQPTTAKQGVTDKQGKFVIREVPPGSYSLAVWTPTQNMLLPDANQGPGSAVLVEVKSGKVIDVGTVKIKRPQ